MQHVITIDEASVLTKRFRENRETVLATAYQGRDLLPLSETFDRSAIEMLLNKPGCTAIRIYYGMDTDLKLHAVIVSSNENNEDIITGDQAQSRGGGEDEGDVLETGVRCPSVCPEPSELNTP